MPYHRKGGRFVKVESEPVQRKRSSKANRVDPPPTDVVDRPSQEESLFDPKVKQPQRGGRLEEPTVPIGERAANEQTRILAGRSSRESEVEQNDPMRDPPVGWLVVVRGPGKGSVLTLGNGMNAIGRGPNSRVQIGFGDDAISSANHARIAYEPRRRKYQLSHGEGTNLTYLNGEMVMDATEIEAGAVIEIGETTLRFQPFCSEEFDWPDVDD